MTAENPKLQIVIVAGNHDLSLIHILYRESYPIVPDLRKNQPMPLLYLLPERQDDARPDVKQCVQQSERTEYNGNLFI